MNVLNQAQNNLTLSKEIKTNHFLSFLDIVIKRREDGFIQHSDYRKTSGKGQYLNFHSYCTIQYKRGLVRTLFDRVSRICTSNTRQKVNDINGYFRSKRINRNKSKVVQKKPVFITLPFKDDSFTCTMKQRLKNIIESTYCAARLNLLSKTKPIYVPNSGRINNDSVTSHCIYRFICDYGSNYIERTERTLKTRVREHIPEWLENQINSRNPIDGNGRYSVSSIAGHLIETGHKVNVNNNSFKVVYKEKRGGCLNMLKQ